MDTYGNTDKTMEIDAYFEKGWEIYTLKIQ